MFTVSLEIASICSENKISVSRHEVSISRIPSHSRSQHYTLRTPAICFTMIHTVWHLAVNFDYSKSAPHSNIS